MNYAISRDGASIGEFEEAELRQGVRNGRFSANDFAWAEGMADWQPLGEVLGLSASPPPLPPAGAPLFQPQGSQPAKEMGDDLGMRILLPVGRSGWAIAAGYLGLFALLIFPAPLALIVSIVAIMDIQKSKKPGQKRKHGMGRAGFGLVAGILGTLALGYFVLLWVNRGE